MMSSGTLWFQRLFGLTKKKALMIKINTISNNLAWKKYLGNPNQFIQRKVKNVNSRFKDYRKNIIFCTLLLSGNKEIKKLNKKFRKKNKTTDILSFPYYETKETRKRLKLNKNTYLGDIIINLYKIDKRESKFRKEFNKLLVHGLVHLLGHRHYKNIDFYKMIKVENKILKQLEC